MTSSFNGLYCIHLELTSRCNKNCWMCGRRKIDREYPEIAMNYGDMDFKLVKKIAAQLPEGIVVQFHNNGEPLLYPKFGEAVRLFKDQIKCVDTNAKLIVEKADEIIDNLDTMSKTEWDVLHGGYNNEFVRENPNLGVPLDMCRELEKEGAFAKMYPYYYMTTGVNAAIPVMQRIGREMGTDMQTEGIDAALLVSS